MSLPRRIRPIALLAVAACSGPTAGLNGTWRTLPVPSGGYTALSLTAAGRQVTGTGQQYGLMGRPGAALVIAGQQSRGTFSLIVKPDSGPVATYSGNIVGGDELDGTWTVAGKPPQPLRFLRQRE